MTATYLQLLALASVFAHIVFSSPTPNSGLPIKPFGNTVTDKYDDLGITAPVFVPGATQTYITSDGGVSYTNLILATQPDPAVAGVQAQSSPNYAVFLQTGGSTTSAATTGLCFQPKQIFFGCEIMSAENTAAVQVPCKFTMTGFNNVLDKYVGSQTFRFSPQGATGPLAPASIDAKLLGPSSTVRFKSELDLDALGLDAITQILTTLNIGSLTDALLVTLFDDFKYTQYGLGDYANCGSSYRG